MTKRLPRIGLVVPALKEGGGVPAVARFVRDVIHRSARFELKVVSLATSAQDDCNLSVARPRTWFRGASKERGTWQGLAFTHVGATCGEFEFQRYRSRKVLRESLDDCDVIQVVSGCPAWAWAVCDLGKPVALQCATRARVERRRRDRVEGGPLKLWRRGMTIITDWMDDETLGKVNAIQVENQWMFDYARELNRGRDVDLRYAPPGIDSQTFRPSAERGVGAVDYILCVGRLDDPRKNIGLLLEAYAAMHRRTRRPVRLVLAGASGPSEAFWDRATALGVRELVTYIPRPSLDALIGLYQGAVAFALPSDEEGLGVVVLEAMACGVPVVATRSGGPDGIITDDADGFLVDLDDVDALARRLYALCVDRDLNVSMGRKARATIERRFSDEVAGVAFRETWERLLARSGYSASSP